MASLSNLRLALALVGSLTLVVPIVGLAASEMPAAQPPWMAVFDTAEFLASSEQRPPDTTAAWTPVSLPDEWRRTNSEGAGQGWYRIRVDLPRAPTAMHAILIRYPRSYQVDYFVNGDLVGGSRDTSSNARGGSLLGASVFIAVPPSLLRAGANVIYIRMQATSAAADMHGLGRVTFGNAREVRKRWIGFSEREFEALRTFFAMAFAAGLIALCLWLARRDDRVMLLLAVTYLSWSFAAGWLYPLRWFELPPALHGILQMYARYAFAPLSVILCLRTAGLHYPRFEAALWAYLVTQSTFPLWGMGNAGIWHLTWDAMNATVLMTGVAIIVFRAKRPLRWSVNVSIATLFLMGGLMSSELMRYFGWVDVESQLLRHFHVPLMIFGIGAAIFGPHVLGIWNTERMHAELGKRLVEMTREIEANQARVAEAMHEQALARERQRILADMDDGLGANLVGLLRHVQSGGVDRPGFEQRVKEALQELRIAIDALEPSGGDLATVLGNLRYRLEPLIEHTGMSLQWDVGELPQIEGLEPSAVFALQRIVLEAIANALKHSGATRVRLAAQAAANGGVEIRIEDAGRGFDLSTKATGLGLSAMHARATRIGAQLDISSQPGAGTVVRLSISRILARFAEDEAAGKPDPRALHDLIPTSAAT
jgi:signal transduction histidine kinase